MMWRSPHRIIAEIYLCIGGYYARMLCSIPSVVQGLFLGCVECRHGVSNWMSSYLSSRGLLLCAVVLISTLKKIHLLYIIRVVF